MPALRCTRAGRPGWKWGENGHCFTEPNARAIVAHIAQQSGEGHADQADPLRALGLPGGALREVRALWVRRVRQLHDALRDALGDPAGGRPTNGLLRVAHLWQVGRPAPTRALDRIARRVERLTAARYTRAVSVMTGSPRPIPHFPGIRAGAWVREAARAMHRHEGCIAAEAVDLVACAAEAGATRPQILSLLRAQAVTDRANTLALAASLLSELHSATARATQQVTGAASFVWMTTSPEGCGCSCAHHALHGTTHTHHAGHPTEGYPGMGGCTCLAVPALGR